MRGLAVSVKFNGRPRDRAVRAMECLSGSPRISVSLGRVFLSFSI